MEQASQAAAPMLLLAVMQHNRPHILLGRTLQRGATAGTRKAWALELAGSALEPQAVPLI